MMQEGLNDIFTEGTEGISTGDFRQDMLPIPTNEDWCMLAVIMGTMTEGVVSFRKYWDNSFAPKIFNGIVRYEGSDEIPPDGALVEGDIVRANRSVDDSDNITYHVLLQRGSEIIFVEDLDGINGRQIMFDPGGAIVVPPGSQVLPLLSVEPVSFFYNSIPPFKAGRIYPGIKKDDVYIVWVTSHGDGVTTFQTTAGGFTWIITTDGAGHVTDFTST